MVNRISAKQRLGELFMKSRADGGATQEQMALALDVSKKTIHDWECGISSPRVHQIFEWFRYLGLNPMSYIYAYLYPESFSFPMEVGKRSDVNIALFNLIDGLDDNTKRQLVYILKGDHGSSPLAEIQLCCAHCHTSMKSRVVTAQTLISAYELDKELGQLVKPDDAQPDFSLLNAAIEQGKRAVIQGHYGYNVDMEGK